MPTKDHSTQPASDDDLFNNVAPTFTKRLENLFDKRAHELRHKISEVTVSKIGPVIDPVHPRYALYREHAEKIGEDFLSAFDSIIARHCGVISHSAKRVLFKLFYERYRTALVREEASLRALAASLGRNRDFNSMVLPAKSIYETSHSTYFKRLEEEILKHNLELSVKAKHEQELWKEIEFARSQTRRAIKAEQQAGKAKTSKGKIKSKAEMRVIYNSLVVFHANKRTEYEQKNGTRYGAAKYANEQTAKEIWKRYHKKVSPRNVRDAMSRN